MRTYLLNALFILFLTSCSLTPKSSDEHKRAPNSGAVTALELQQSSPIRLLQVLQANAGSGLMVEKSDIRFWGEAEINELKSFVDDPSPAAPVYRSTSGVLCTGPKFASTVGHEAKHLIAAIKKGIYPLSQCSTYDLKISDSY